MSTTSDPACACTTLRKATRAITRLYDEALAPTGMTITQFAILRNVARRGTVALSRLAEILVMERTSLYRALAPLERLGWLAIADAGARTKAVTVTDAGHEALERAGAPWQAMQRRLIGAFGAEQWAALEATLGRLSTLAQEADA
ncbi:MarR family winged helix-turn-helix transcriptional regulator [Sphingomonas sp. NFR15]|uniref:MarR family winged helix-turn-helix transcriptional regulator n=1 Tax=Sphingomonas sp. NFR15 TaxID=1566282 RepID=UPI000887F14A|nr:MarR family winged helix-turn-helix transcriptional regulator [Sphingomonas sp. NFR15]SDA17042.1 DNA-binding transcriptional regulator, MarR family [Sphingomonas sp. NFR15]